MDDPAGYRVPIHQALTRVFTLGGVPRQLLMATAMFCLGAGMVFKSWGALPLYLIAHAVMAYLTWRDPYWPQILAEAVRFACTLRRHRLYVVPNDRVAALAVALRVAFALAGGVVLLLAAASVLAALEGS